MSDEGKNEEQVVGIVMPHPRELALDDWGKVLNIARKIQASGETNSLKAAILAYFEWIGTGSNIEH